jgi:tetratricopeptide (TPR) repeat protein
MCSPGTAPMLVVRAQRSWASFPFGVGLCFRQVQGDGGGISYCGVARQLFGVAFLHHAFLPAGAQERPPEFEEMYQRGLALYEAGKYGEAIPIAEQYLAMAAARYGEQHRLYATGLGYLAILRQAQDCFAGAEPLIKRALAITETRQALIMSR